MLVAPDHTDQVRRVYRLLTGPLRPTNLVLPQRRLVCYCRLYEVSEFPSVESRQVVFSAIRQVTVLLLIIASEGYVITHLSQLNSKTATLRRKVIFTPATFFSFIYTFQFYYKKEYAFFKPEPCGKWKCFWH